MIEDTGGIKSVVDSNADALEILEDHFHYTGFVRPNLANGISIQSAAGAWAAFPTPTQIIAASDITSIFDIHWLDIADISAADDYQIQLYTGAALSEVLLDPSTFSAVAGSLKISAFATGTIRVPANTRISAALSNKNAAQRTLALKLKGHTY